ncbi:hypothetical protein [Sinorhizobium meliloti]|uniref:hypothetical protein n=1 Tax=Rhizobium meliloti TaxID=382 RepID=UPI00299D18A6|nr:hypothetical protein [Sinorhizobium meliloti]
MHYQFGMAKKMKRDNDYYLERLKVEHPAIYADLGAGKYLSARQAFTAAGYRKDPALLTKLKGMWTKADASEQREFLRWLGLGGSVSAGASSTSSRHAPTPTATSSGAGSAPRKLTPSEIAQIEAIMRRRNLKPGAVMKELGCDPSDGSLGMAMSHRKPTQIKNAALLSELEKWLDKHK